MTFENKMSYALTECGKVWVTFFCKSFQVKLNYDKLKFEELSSKNSIKLKWVEFKKSLNEFVFWKLNSIELN